REPLELLDEIEQRIGLRPTPLNWPVGIAGDFRGLIDRASGTYTKMTRQPGGATKALEEVLDADEAARIEGAEWVQAQEEIELLEALGADFDHDSFMAGESSPVLFGAALPNFGVGQLLEAVVGLAPAPAAKADAVERERPVEAPFSGQVFKMQANMDKNHRDRMAFVRVSSGRFDRGMVLTHAATGRPFATKYSQAVFGSERST
ncbi:peptide chain release factor 3, partial [Nocardiopsis sp. NRRL B-16309]